MLTVPAAPRILIFPASLRRASHQRRLAGYCAAVLAGRCTVDIIQPGEIELPLYNQDLESEPQILAAMSAAGRRFAAADGVIIAAPEYNAHVSPYLKNTFDWVSRLPRVQPDAAEPHPFRDKPLLLTSASTGWTGGLLGLQSARSFLAYLGYLVVSPQICVSDADQWVAGDGYRFDPGFADHIAQVLSQFLDLVEGLARARDAHPLSKPAREPAYA